MYRNSLRRKSHWSPSLHLKTAHMLLGGLGRITGSTENIKFKWEMKTAAGGGEGLEKTQLCLYHQGSLISFLPSVHLLSNSHSAVVVLTNSMANSDVAIGLERCYWRLCWTTLTRKTTCKSPKKPSKLAEIMAKDGGTAKITTCTRHFYFSYIPSILFVT
jgi:hypothetical protein